MGVTKGRIVTHMHLRIVFKWAMHFSKLVITRFNSSTKLFLKKLWHSKVIMYLVISDLQCKQLSHKSIINFIANSTIASYLNTTDF